MAKKKLYMLVTQDKYELPVVIAETASELGRILGVPANSIICGCSDYESGRRKKSKYRRVEIEEE